MVVDIGYRDRFAAGVYSGKIEGIMIGLLIIFIVLGLVLQLGMR
jgi:tetrahydromethanopterin S-methyltransferase subunit A